MRWRNTGLRASPVGKWPGLTPLASSRQTPTGTSLASEDGKLQSPKEADSETGQCRAVSVGRLLSWRRRLKPGAHGDSVPALAPDALHPLGREGPFPAAEPEWEWGGILCGAGNHAKNWPGLKVGGYSRQGVPPTPMLLFLEGAVMSYRHQGTPSMDPFCEDQAPGRGPLLTGTMEQPLGTGWLTAWDRKCWGQQGPPAVCRRHC